MIELRKLLLGLSLAIALLCVPGQAQEPLVPKLPLTQSPSTAASAPQQFTFAQQQARFVAEQRMLRMEYNNWIGYSPLRPNMNASYMSSGYQHFYIPSRGVIVSSSPQRAWYW